MCMENYISEDILLKFINELRAQSTITKEDPTTGVIQTLWTSRLKWEDPNTAQDTPPALLAWQKRCPELLNIEIPQKSKRLLRSVVVEEKQGEALKISALFARYRWGDYHDGRYRPIGQKWIFNQFEIGEWISEPQELVKVHSEALSAYTWIGANGEKEKDRERKYFS
jgi:hypothetical protein